MKEECKTGGELKAVLLIDFQIVVLALVNNTYRSHCFQLHWSKTHPWKGTFPSNIFSLSPKCTFLDRCV